MKARAFSNRTIDSVVPRVHNFVEFCREKEIERPSEVSRADVQSYQHALFERRHSRHPDRRLSTRTQTTYLCALKSFYRYLVMSETVIHDPASHLVLPREPKDLPRVILTKSEITRLFSQPDTKTRLGYRDRTMMELFYTTGIRASEATNLEVASVDINRAVVMVRQGKGRKDRVVPMGEVCAEWLEGYLRNVRPKLLSDPREQAVFLTNTGRRWELSALLRRLHAYAARAGIKKRIGCHTFRHTCATHMMRGGADVRVIQELLGHKCLSTTERYLRVEVGDLIRAHKKFHPRERF